MRRSSVGVCQKAEGKLAG